MDELIFNKIIQEAIDKAIQDIISEDKNPVYDRYKNPTTGVFAEIWDAISQKQKSLQKEIFGDLNEDLYDITKEKANQMGEKFLKVPYSVATAGNDKLPENVMVINMSSSLMCPSYYLGLCKITKGQCYAQRGENQYKDVLSNRWKTDLMHTQMLQQYQKGNKTPMRHYFGLIEMYIQLGNAMYKKTLKDEIARYEFSTGQKIPDEIRKAYEISASKYKITDVRLNETGDFQCQLAVELWAKFAKKIKAKYGINTHAYTARNLDFSNAEKYMAINASNENPNVNKETQRQFKAVADDFYNKLNGGDKVDPITKQPILGYIQSTNTYFYKCPCSENESKCDFCRVCFNKNETGKPYTIYVRYHGVKAAKNGFKHILPLSKIDGVINALKNNGWITDKEWDSYNSQRNVSKLSSNKVSGQKTTSKKKSK